MAFKDRLEAAGHETMLIDHGYCYSVYFHDPNGMQVELTCGVAETESIMAKHPSSEAKDYGVKVVNRAFDSVGGCTAVHVCFGYAAMVSDKPAAQPGLELARALEPLGDKTVLVGVLNLVTEEPETAEVVAERISAALEFLPPDRLIAAPDGGMKYPPRSSARAKLSALPEGAALANARL